MVGLRDPSKRRQRKYRSLPATLKPEALLFARAAVLRWVESGRLPARRIGRLIRIEEPVLSAYGKATTPARKAGRPPGAAKTPKPKGEPRKGSPAALLRHCGRLNEQDVEAMMQAIRQAHVVDWEAPVEIPA